MKKSEFRMNLWHAAEHDTHFCALTSAFCIPAPAAAHHPSNSRNANSHCNRCRSLRSRTFFSSAGNKSNVMFAG